MSAVHEAVTQLERLEALDEPAKTIGKSVRDTVPAGPVKDALSGVWAGHALHPVLTDVPIGSYTSAVLLDLIGGSAGEEAADKLIGIGLLATIPTAVTGWTDWADSEVGDPRVRRVGLIHAAANVAGAGLFALSLAARRRGSRGAGKLLGFAGMSVLTAGAHLGGHMSYARGVGVDQTAFEEGPEDWTAVMRDGDLPEGESRYAEVSGAGVMVARWEGTVYALANRCAHRGGPLDEGELSDGCVTCPWHQSVFRLADGGIVQGPSAYPQPTWDVRVSDGVIEIKPPA